MVHDDGMPSGGKTCLCCMKLWSWYTMKTAVFKTWKIRCNLLFIPTLNEEQKAAVLLKMQPFCLVIPTELKPYS